MSEQKLCDATKWKNWQKYRCRNRAITEHEGKAYCGVHDPVRVTAKESARRAERQALQARADARRVLVGRIAETEQAVMNLAIEIYGLGALPPSLRNAIGEMLNARAAVVAHDADVDGP